MGSQINCRSKKDEGTKFFVDIKSKISEEIEEVGSIENQSMEMSPSIDNKMDTDLEQFEISILEDSSYENQLLQ